MASPSAPSWCTDLVPFDDFPWDWTANGLDVLDWDVDGDTLIANDPIVSIESGHAQKAKKSRPYPTNDVPTSTKKLKTILERVKNESELKLYSFVSYDKFDSLIYYPHNLARCYTSANISDHEKLLRRYYTTHCDSVYAEQQIVLQPDATSPVLLTITKSRAVVAQRDYMHVFKLVRDSHPDGVIRVLSTEMISNQLHSTIVYSYTDVPEMYLAATASATRHPYLPVPQIGDRAALLSDFLHLSTYAPSTQLHLLALFNSQAVLMIHVKLKMVYTFKHYAVGNKITTVHSTLLDTSVEHSHVMYTHP